MCLPPSLRLGAQHNFSVTQNCCGIIEPQRGPCTGNAAKARGVGTQDLCCAYNLLSNCGAPTIRELCGAHNLLDLCGAHNA